MQKEFFGKQLDRLRNVYSETSLNEERVKVLWDRFKNTEADRWEKAVNYLIGEYTTQALPSLSKFAEAVMMFRSGNQGENTHMQEMQPSHFCDPCRDYGFGFVGDTLVACSCPNGRQLRPDELARQQGFYDAGAKLMKNPKGLIFHPLPYDPNERNGA